MDAMEPGGRDSAITQRLAAQWPVEQKFPAPISWCGPMGRWTRTRSSSNEFS